MIWLVVAMITGPIALGAARRSGWSYARGDGLDDWINYAASIALLGLFAFAVFKVQPLLGGLS
jgi:hypothetical protein